MNAPPPLTLEAVSPRARLGLKGREAAALLEEAGISTPTRPNSLVTALSVVNIPPAIGAVRCLRLGGTEFLVEDDAATTRIAGVRHLAATARLRAYLAPRSDFSAVLSGPDVFDSLSPFCAYDFAMLRAAPDTVVMTLLADISVVLALEPGSHATPRLRLWADAGYATYLTETLTGDHR